MEPDRSENKITGSEDGLKVLVVDDSLVIRRLVKIYLGRMGIEGIAEAPNGRKAFEKLSTDKFDLIISDWSMPGKTGLNFLKAVRADKRYRKIPFVMLTAEGLKRSIAEAAEAGVTKYILKPFNFETIEKEIGSMLA
jgi:two-component system, chemotaxis family, chemotaxis protein CheY